MTILVRTLDIDYHSTNAMAHITVGTASPNIKPMESNALLDAWTKGRPGVRDVLVKGQISLDGTVRAMLSR